MPSEQQPVPIPALTNEQQQALVLTSLKVKSPQSKEELARMLDHAVQLATSAALHRLLMAQQIGCWVDSDGNPHYKVTSQ